MSAASPISAPRCPASPPTCCRSACASCRRTASSSSACCRRPPPAPCTPRRAPVVRSCRSCGRSLASAPSGSGRRRMASRSALPGRLQHARSVPHTRGRRRALPRPAARRRRGVRRRHRWLRELSLRRREHEAPDVDSRSRRRDLVAARQGTPLRLPSGAAGDRFARLFQLDVAAPLDDDPSPDDVTSGRRTWSTRRTDGLVDIL